MKTDKIKPFTPRGLDVKLKVESEFGLLLALGLGIALIAALYMFPEVLQMNPYSMHKRIKSLESRVYDLEKK